MASNNQKEQKFIDLLNSTYSSIKKRVEAEKSVAKYRFMNTYNEGEAVIGALKKKEEIKNQNFNVDIYEDLECKDVKNGSRYFIKISDISGIFVDIDLLYYEEKIKDFEFDAVAYIANNLAKITGSLNQHVKDIADDIAEFIACVMYIREFYILQYKTIGWEYYNKSDNKGLWFFKYDKIYCNVPLDINKYTEYPSYKELETEQNTVGKWLYECEKIYKSKSLYIKGHLPISLADGLGAVDENNLNKELEWVSHTIKLLNNSTYNSLILGAGISGLVRQLIPYTKETNININIKGDPASGKSTICHYLLSIFGNPELIEGSFIDTDNSMEETRAKRPVLPYVLDDRMLKIRTESEKNKEKIILADIFREYEGKVKERYGKQYENMAGNRIYGPIISSSVNSMIELLDNYRDIGQYRRFMEFDIGEASDRKLFRDAAEASHTEKIAYANYGYGIRIIINYMLRSLNNTLDNDKKIKNEAEALIDRFNSLKDYIEVQLNNNGIKGAESSASRFALIIVSYQILREALLFYNYDTILKNVNIKNIKDKKMFNKMFALENVGDEIELGNTYLKNENIMITFNDFEEKSNIIPDASDKILSILTDNLIKKMKGIKKTKEEQVNNIYDYIIKYRQYFKEGQDIKEFKPQMLQEIIEARGECLGFCVINVSEKKIDLFTPDELYLSQFLYADTILEPEVIKQYLRELKEKNINGKNEAEKYGEKYNIKKYSYSDLKKLQGYVTRTYKKINGKPVHFIQFNFKYKEIKEDTKDNKDNKKNKNKEDIKE